MLTMFFAAIWGNLTPVRSVSVIPLSPEQHEERTPKMVKRGKQRQAIHHEKSTRTRSQKMQLKHFWAEEAISILS